MSVILKLTKRNMLNYFYDKTSIFFSLLSVFIIIFLYVAFLGDLQVQNLRSTVGDIEGIRWMVDTWILAGIITANSVTVPLSILSDMIQDVENNRINDFLTAPISRKQIVVGYLAASWIIGVLMSIITFFIGEVYVFVNGGEFVSFITLIQTILLIILSVVSFSSISFFVLSFVKSINTVGIINTLMGTLIGFLAGIYIPIGVFEGAIQYVIKLNPAAHMASLFRQIFMEKPLQMIFKGAPTEYINEYKHFHGVNLNIFGSDISVPFMVLYLILISLIFYSLSVLRLSKVKR